MIEITVNGTNPDGITSFATLADALKKASTMATKQTPVNITLCNGYHAAKSLPPWVSVDDFQIKPGDPIYAHIPYFEPTTPQGMIQRILTDAG